MDLELLKEKISRFGKSTGDVSSRITPGSATERNQDLRVDRLVAAKRPGAISCQVQVPRHGRRNEADHSAAGEAEERKARAGH